MGAGYLTHNTYQVRSESGKNTLIIKMRYEDTIADVRKYIDDHRYEAAERGCIAFLVHTR